MNSHRSKLYGMRSVLVVTGIRGSARRIATLIAGTATCLAAAACASAGTYNPDNLPTDQVGRIAQICQVVMGLNASEPPVSGVHPGTPHLDPDVSHYQGCIASLSDSMQGVNEARAVRHADADCRAEGLVPGSPELAVCVLQTTAENRNPVAQKVASRVPIPRDQAKATRVGSFFYISSDKENTATGQVSSSAQTLSQTTVTATRVGSLFYASPRETLRREQLACARLGLEPPGDAFTSCVKGLETTFFAIDNPLD